MNGTGDMQPTYSMGASLPLYVMIPDETTVLQAKNKIDEYLGKSSEIINDQEETNDKSGQN